MAYIFSFVILFLASYVSAVYADNSDAGNLGPNNVDQIPSNNGHHHHHGRKTTTKQPSRGTRPTVASIVTTEVPITNTTTCTNCAPSLNVTPGSAPINQTQGVDPNTDCSTITFSCSNPGSGPIAFQYFYQGQDLGTTIQNGTSGTTIPNQITKMVVCNKAGQYWFVENSINRFIDTVNCIVATTCTNCAPSLNVTPGSAPINQTQGVDPNTGCSTITFSCSNPGSGPIAFQYFYQGQDLGTTIQNGTSGTTIPNQITRMVVCNQAGQYWFVENSINRFIDTVNCIVA